VPRRQNLESEAQLERFLDRVAQVLETFAKGFIELRRGYEAFSEEMGVGSVTRRDSRVASFDKIPKVLEYLLDEAQSEARVAELTRGFADVMIHQVALVGGIRRGVRAALDRISPDGSGSAADHAASLTGERRGLSVRAMPSSQRSLSASARS
jgi:hypothetical protein